MIYVRKQLLLWLSRITVFEMSIGEVWDVHVGSNNV